MSTARRKCIRDRCLDVVTGTERAVGEDAFVCKDGTSIAGKFGIPLLE
ncbi:hypothetical protein [Rhodococcus sp. SMB37]|nr:hypothetical protein [Rhodococcus sp. SMB37]